MSLIQLVTFSLTYSSKYSLEPIAAYYYYYYYYVAV